MTEPWACLLGTNSTRHPKSNTYQRNAKSVKTSAITRTKQLLQLICFSCIGSNTQRSLNLEQNGSKFPELKLIHTAKAMEHCFTLHITDVKLPGWRKYLFLGVSEPQEPVQETRE